jgi:adenylate cyclase
MAFFGLPFVSSKDSIHACNAALRIREIIKVTNAKRVAQGKKVFEMGIGINTGMVLSGNIGNAKRMDYCCIGAPVNITTHTEELTKYYGVQILITEHTLLETGEIFLTREIESILLKDQESSVRIYELVGKKNDAIDFNQRESIRLYEAALSLYRRQEFATAAELFSQAIKSTNDGPSKALLERAKYYDQNPPGDNWKADFDTAAKETIFNTF